MTNALNIFEQIPKLLEHVPEIIQRCTNFHSIFCPYILRFKLKVIIESLCDLLCFYIKLVCKRVSPITFYAVMFQL